MREYIEVFREVWTSLPQEDRWAAYITAVAGTLLVVWINCMI